MNGPCVIRLDHTAPPVAAAIHVVMMAAYGVEAGILDIKDFGPLRRTPAQIARASGPFVGIAVGGTLAAVAELETGKDGVHIAALVVHPGQFRRGLATALLREIIRVHASDDVSVSTAAGNRPALRLYSAAGFHGDHRWTTDDGIPMVTLRRGGGSRADKGVIVD
jgi:ribosomal protein S18 acetylase RimI-like enzyme